METDDVDASAATREAIMRATYRALCKHGYADLTMQAIADEFDKTKAVIHYHYDTKGKLLVAFLDYLLERFDRDIDVDGYGTPDGQLLGVIDELLGTGEREGDGEFDHRGLTTALLGIRAGAPYNEEFRRQLTINVEAVRDLLAAIIEDGIERGAFREVDPDRTAMTLLACTTGARNYEVTLDRDGVEAEVRETIDEIVDGWLCRPEDG